MFSAIIFTLKILIAALVVIPIFISKRPVVSRDRIAIYSIISVVAATITIVSDKLGSGIVVGSFIIAIGIVSYSQFQKEDNWIDALQSISPLWLVTVIGMCIGASMLLQAVILTAVSFYIVNYLPMLLKPSGTDKISSNE